MQRLACRAKHVDRDLLRRMQAKCRSDGERIEPERQQKQIQLSTDRGPGDLRPGAGAHPRRRTAPTLPLQLPPRPALGSPSARGRAELDPRLKPILCSLLQAPSRCRANPCHQLPRDKENSDNSPQPPADHAPHLPQNPAPSHEPLLYPLSYGGQSRRPAGVSASRTGRAVLSTSATGSVERLARNLPDRAMVAPPEHGYRRSCASSLRSQADAAPAFLKAW